MSQGYHHTYIINGDCVASVFRIIPPPFFSDPFLREEKVDQNFEELMENDDRTIM